ncbi:MAG: HEAT repeat domain-containing protein [Planctomycetes bacterium]|nr:HEAT repeat domain-containing protein [Planctomycetota bacterium]
MKPLFPAVSSLLLAAIVTAQQKDPELERARKLLGERTEDEVTAGADLCAKANSPAAVEVLLEVLAEVERRTHMHLSPGHYRDIVWDALVRITDPYARRRVEHELKNGRDQNVRQWCAELLGIYGEAGFGESLKRALSAKDEDIVRQAARALGLLKFEGAIGPLSTLTRHRNDYVRANAIEALARISPAQSGQFLAAIAQDRSGGVRCALLGAAPQLCGDQTEALSTTALRDADWRPRMQAVQNLGQIKTKTAVDALITALRDGRPVVAARAMHELQELTGEPIQQVEVWEKWWPEHREMFGFPGQRGIGKREGGTVAYNGVPVDSDHMAFLIDKSVMMRANLGSKGMSKEAAAQAELQQVLEQLNGKVTFNVFHYDVAVTAFEKKAIPLTEKSRKRALEFAAVKSAGREKDIWQALVAVVADPTLDTAYLLSSGEPDTGLYVHWNRVTRHLADLNRFHKVTVHAVAYTDNEWYRDQLKKIAEATGGHFRSLE